MEKILKDLERKGVDITVFPELSLVGYCPKDLLMRYDFLKKAEMELMELVDFTKDMDMTVIVGTPRMGGSVYNSAVVFREGEIVSIYDKRVLDSAESRYFSTGDDIAALSTPEGNIGILIRDDLWEITGPAEEYAELGIDLLIDISASAYVRKRPEFRKDVASLKAKSHRYWIVYLNAIGGVDEFVFDGSSFVVDPKGEIYHELKMFEEEISIVDVDMSFSKSFKLLSSNKKIIDEDLAIPLDYIPIREKHDSFKPRILEKVKEEEQLLRALMTALKDYVEMNGFSKVVIGLSGGIDSSLVASVATLALGKENVLGVLMPSMYTSKESTEDAQELASNLGIKTYTIPITDVFNEYLNALKEPFEGKERNVAEENLQARIRGTYLMAISNKLGHLVISTGNKSEAATGYATLYGDMVGGYSLIKDLYKTDVYKVARWINEREGREIIPKRVFEKPPSAELSPGQKDQDKLPPYELLDKILTLLIDENRTPDQIVDSGFDRETVEYVLKLVKDSEYKRYQAAPGPKITGRLLGVEWRYPITNKYIF